MKKLLNVLIRVPLFFVVTPVILFVLAITWIIVAFVMLIGTFYMMIEFLIYGDTKIEKNIEVGVEKHENTYDTIDCDIDDVSGRNRLSNDYE